MNKENDGEWYADGEENWRCWGDYCQTYDGKMVDKMIMEEMMLAEMIMPWWKWRSELRIKVYAYFILLQ